MNQLTSNGAFLAPAKPSHSATSLERTLRRLGGRRCATAIGTALISLLLSATALGEVEDPASRYRVLEWKDLVAEGWERPLLLSKEEVSSPTIDESSLVPELDQQLVAIPGYMRPAVKLGQQVLAHDHDHEHHDLAEGTYVTEFLLVPFLPSNPCSHALWDPNQVVYVNLLEPVLVDDPENPVWVVGTITLDNIMTDDGLSAYRVVDAVTTKYEY